MFHAACLLFVSCFCPAFRDGRTKNSSFTPALRRNTSYTCHLEHLQKILLSGHHLTSFLAPDPWPDRTAKSANIPLGTQTLSCEPHTSSETPPKRRRLQRYYSGIATIPATLTGLFSHLALVRPDAIVLTARTRLHVTAGRLFSFYFLNLPTSHSVCQLAARALLYHSLFRPSDFAVCAR